MSAAQERTQGTGKDYGMNHHLVLIAETKNMGMVTQKRIIFRSLFLKKFLGIPAFKRKREKRTVKVSGTEWQRVGRKTSTESFTLEYTGNIYYVLLEFVD